MKRALHIPLDNKRSHRLIYHAESAFCWTRPAWEQDQFLAFALTLEDLTGLEWSSIRVAQIFVILQDETRLPDFLDFYHALEGKFNQGPLDLSGTAKLYLAILRGEVHETKEDSSDAFYW